MTGDAPAAAPGAGRPSAAPDAPRKGRVTAGVLAILFGALGLHKFYLGYPQAGLVMLGVTLVGSIFSFGTSALAMAVVGVVEGVIYLLRPQDAFARTYVDRTRLWF